MKNKRGCFRRLISLTTAAVIALGYPAVKVNGENTMTDYVTSKTDIQALLARPYTEGVPLGYNEDVYSLYQPGWGFDSPTSYRSGSDAGFGMKLELFENGMKIPAGEGTHTPSYTTVTNAVGEESVNYVNLLLSDDVKISVSFAQTSYGNDYTMAFDGITDDPGNNWNTWCAVPRNETEWLEIEFPQAVSAEALALYIYTDSNCLPPEKVAGKYLSGSEWKELTGLDFSSLASGKNILTFDRAESTSFRFYFTPEKDKALSFNEIELLYGQQADIKGSYSVDKYVLADGGLAVIINADNRSDEDIVLSSVVTPLFDAEYFEGNLVGNAAGFILVCGGSEFTVDENTLKREITVKSGNKITLKAITSFGDSWSEAVKIAEGFYSDSDPIKTQTDKFIGWFEDNVPYIDIPDENIRKIYYYRWYSYRANIRRLSSGGYNVTEFLPKVGWSGAENSINMAVGFHLADGRWIRDTKYMRGNIDFWLNGEGKDNSRSFTSWLIRGVYDYYLATADESVFSLIDKLKADYEGWEKEHFDVKKGLFISNNGVDGMEYSAVAPDTWGIEGYRPTANAYRYGDALALAELCRIAGDTAGAGVYTEKAEKLKQNIEKCLWDAEADFYKWIVLGTDTQTEPLELIGYIPWMFSLAPDDEDHAAAWDYLDDPDIFASAYGMRTVEKKYAAEVPEGDIGGGTCRWNGPVWPFATSETLYALNNFIRTYESGAAYSDRFADQLLVYAKSQYKDGYPWIAEDIDGETGKWIADCERSPLYNHSTFCDLVISGLFGIGTEDGCLSVSPLMPGEYDYFCIENVPVQGHNVTVIFDRDGSRYAVGVGLIVISDGKIVYNGSEGKQVISFDAPEVETDERREKTAGGILPVAIGAAVAAVGAAAAVIGIKKKKKKQ